MNILISNDDGIFAEGIIELAKAMRELGNVYIVAPNTQRSATGHAITIHDPIMVNKVDIYEDIEAYSISGTPADCVKLGIEGLLKDIHIDLVLSGINNGPNLGTDVVYSGTVSAAIEGYIQEKRAIALSINEFGVSKSDYQKAAEHVVKLVKKLENNLSFMDDCVLNVNIPNEEVKGIKITTLGNRKYENVLEERKSPHGQTYYWIGGKVRELDQDENSDIIAVQDGYISVTPIHINMTSFDKLRELNEIILS